MNKSQVNVKIEACTNTIKKELTWEMSKMYFPLFCLS